MGELDARIHAGEPVVDGTLIAGDTFTTYWRAGIPNRMLQRFPLASMGAQERSEVVESAAAPRAFSAAALVCGRGPAVRSPIEAIDAAISRAGGR